MVKLYCWNQKTGRWVLCDYGVKSKVREYLSQGYIVIFM